MIEAAKRMDRVFWTYSTQIRRGKIKDSDSWGVMSPSQVLGGLCRALGEMEQVQVGLYGCHAGQPAVVMFTAENARVVGTDQLNVRASGFPPDAEAIGGLPGIAVNVDGR